LDYHDIKTKSKEPILHIKTKVKELNLRIGYGRELTKKKRGQRDGSRGEAGTRACQETHKPKSKSEIRNQNP
jgi:hypothetical protein